MNIEQFQEELSNFKWHHARGEQLIRTNFEGTNCCPITAVAMKLTGRYFNICNAHNAGAAIGLDTITRHEIMSIADCFNPHSYYFMFRLY